MPLMVTDKRVAAVVATAALPIMMVTLALLAAAAGEADMDVVFLGFRQVLAALAALAAAAGAAVIDKTIIGIVLVVVAFLAAATVNMVQPTPAAEKVVAALAWVGPFLTLLAQLR